MYARQARAFGPPTVALFLTATASCGIAAAADLSQIQTIVVLFPENRSFDHLYGLFPGANRLANATPERTLQRDHDGSILPYLTVWDKDGKPSPDFPRLPNAPFRIDAPPVNKGQGQVLLSPIHAYYHSIEQIDLDTLAWVGQ